MVRVEAADGVSRSWSWLREDMASNVMFCSRTDRADEKQRSRGPCELPARCVIQ